MRWIILFLLLCPFVIADYEQWHFPDDTFIYDNLNYSLDYSNNNLLVRQDSELLLITLNDCEANLYNEFCFVEEIFDLSGGYGLGYGRYNPETGVAEKSLKIKISSVGPEIIFSRTISKTDPAINEQVFVNTIIKNIGNVKAENIFFSETFFKNLKISGVVGALKNGKRIYFELPIINKDSEHEFNYTITPESLLEDTSISVLRYYYGGETINVDINPVSISVPELHEVSVVKPSKALIDELKELKISIINSDPIAEIKFSKFIVTIPVGVDVVFPEMITKKNNLYKWNGTLEHSSELIFIFNLSSRNINNYPISLIYNLEVNEYSYSGEESFNFEVDINKLTPSISISKSNVDATEPFNVSLTLKNSNSELVFYDIEGSMTSEAFEPLEFNILNINPSKELEVLNSLILQGYPVSGYTQILVSGKYKTPTGQILRFSTEKTINIREFNFPFHAEIETSKVKYKKGDKVSVKVRLFKDSNLENLTITHYEESKNIILNESEIIVWDYNFTIQENISLETKISFLLDGQEFKEVYTKNLTLKKIVVTDKTSDKKEDVEDKPEDVEGWLFKIIDSFEKFMSGIFG